MVHPMRGVELNRDDEAPVEAHSCPAGHPVRPGSRRCPTCCMEVGLPHPGTGSGTTTRTWTTWLVVGALAVALVHVVVIALVLALR